MCVDFRDRSADPTYKNGVHSIGIFLFFFLIKRTYNKTRVAVATGYRTRRVTSIITYIFKVVERGPARTGLLWRRIWTSIIVYIVYIIRIRAR